MLRCFLPLLCAMVFVGSVSAQSAGSMEVCDRKQTLPAAAATLTYDVASIHLHQLSSGNFTFSQYDDPADVARLKITNVAMVEIIQGAYSINRYQVSGGPSWLDSNRFDVEARSDAAADAVLASLSKCQRQLTKEHMLQMLLADRVKLVVSAGSREVSGYKLVVAKDGPKLKASEDGAKGNTSNFRASRLGYSLTSYGDNLASIAAWLSVEMKRPVVDETGLTGKYDIDLKWSEDLDAPAAGETPYPAMVTALPEQLGLKLEPEKGPVKVLVIDHVERPSEN